MTQTENEADGLYAGCLAELSYGRYWDRSDCKVRVLLTAGDVALVVDAHDVDALRQPCLFVVSRYRLTLLGES